VGDQIDAETPSVSNYIIGALTKSQEIRGLSDLVSNFAYQPKTAALRLPKGVNLSDKQIEATATIDVKFTDL